MTLAEALQHEADGWVSVRFRDGIPYLSALPVRFSKDEATDVPMLDDKARRIEELELERVALQARIRELAKEKAIVAGDGL